MLDEKTFEKLKKFRKKLHKNPELSNQEEKTPQRLKKFLKKYHPDKIIEGIGGNGIVFVFEGKEEGPHVAFRAELDALPIAESNDFDYKSKKEGVGHQCGHDGHMTIVCSLAEFFKENKPEKGKAFLLFQPAEETGEGAQQMVEDEALKELNIDYIFGLHNLPGVEEHHVYTHPEVVTAASRGIIIKLRGATSHAATPHKGKNPDRALAEMVQAFHTIVEEKEGFEDFILITVIHMLLGEIAFGTTPGYGELRATLRAFKNEDIDTLVEKVEKVIKEIAEKYKLKFSIDYTEIFESTYNTKESFEIIQKAAEKSGLEFKEIDRPYAWCEDFGRFTQPYEAGFFILGAGEDLPMLHNEDYDFPDELILSGHSMFQNIAQQLLYSSN